MGADQRDQRAGDQQHVDRVEARQRGRPEFGAGSQEVAQVGADQRSGAVDVDAHDRRPVGALVERQQVAGEGHHHRQDQQHHADHPVQLARVLVGAEEERAAHVQEHEDHHHARAPLVHAADELAEEHVVGHVANRFVRAAGGIRAVVHRQENAGDGLREEGEHRRGAERVEPVGALRHLAEHQPAGAAAQRGALVDPVDDVDPGRLGALGHAALAVALAGARGRRLERGGDWGCRKLGHGLRTGGQRWSLAWTWLGPELARGGATGRGTARRRPAARPGRAARSV